MSQEVLLFQVGEVLCGLRTSDVREVLRAATPFAMAEASPAISGMIDLRGRVVPVFSARRLWGMSDRPMQATDHLIVLEHGGEWAALHVDRAIDLEVIESSLGPDRDEEQRFRGSYAKTPLGLAQIISAAALMRVSRAASLVAVEPPVRDET